MCFEYFRHCGLQINMSVYVRTCDGVDHCTKDGGGLDKLFEDVGLCGQGKAIVQHLLEQFIYHYHIVFDGSLCTHTKIVLTT